MGRMTEEDAVSLEADIERMMDMKEERDGQEHHA